MHHSQLQQLGVALRMKLPKKNPLMRNFPRLSPMRGERLWRKIPREKKGIIGSQRRGNLNVFSHFPKASTCEVCTKTTTTTTRVRCRRIFLRSAWTGFHLQQQFGDLITADQKILNVENESRSGRKNASIVQDYFSNWIQSYPLENERNIGDKVVFTKISSSFTEAGKT